MSENDLIQRASEYATNAHKRIDHRRKYTKHPYSVHLASVAKMVAEVTDDAEIIAAAWLHDVVEDTPATLADIERNFGRRIARLVDELTDVSKPSDGNRAVRKALDRDHLAAASSDAMTVKLADLTDNCRDICRNDKRFAKVYVKEMEALLAVLSGGDSTLFKLASDTLEKCKSDLEANREPVESFTPPVGFLPRRLARQSHLGRLFTESFSAQDIAEPIRSFDIDSDGDTVRQVMKEQGIEIAGMREKGVIVGFIRIADFNDGSCRENTRAFRHGQVLDSDASLSDVIHVLTLQEHCFVSLLGEVVGYISRNEINKPVVRMWLFGIITFIEMELVQIIEERFPQDGWSGLLSEARLAKAQRLREERLRRGQQCELVDCLQLSDKGQILIQSSEFLQEVMGASRRTAKRIVRELESLRNNLAHAQDITTHDWAPIVRLTYRIEETYTGRRSNITE